MDMEFILLVKGKYVFKQIILTTTTLLDCFNIHKGAHDDVPFGDCRFFSVKKPASLRCTVTMVTWYHYKERRVKPQRVSS